MTGNAAMPDSLRYALLARQQIIRGVHAWVARDFPHEEAIAMTAALLDASAEEVSAVMAAGPDGRPEADPA